MTEAKTKSRFPRTGTLLFIGLALLISGGVLMVWLPYHRERRVIAEIERLGGGVETEVVRPFWIPDAVADEYLWVFEKVDAIEFRNKRFSDIGLEHLRGTTNLECLILKETQLTDAGLRDFRRMTNLNILDLSGSDVSDAGLEHLQGMTNLEYLDLYNTQVTGTGFRHLLVLKSLRNLGLERTQVGDAGLRDLRGMTNLELVLLNHTQVTEAGVESLQKALPGLRIVWMPSSP